MKTSLAKAIRAWEEKTEQSASEAEIIKVNFSIPPIDKLDSSIISNFINCRQLSLSTNCIEKMVTIQGLKNLEILSIGRNQIKKIYGLESIGPNLKELWISYNYIEKLDGLAPHCTGLTTLYMAHNKIKEWGEIDKIKDLGNLKNCVFLGNEIYDKFQSKEDARLNVLKKLNNLTMIDNVIVTVSEKEQVGVEEDKKEE